MNWFVYIIKLNNKSYYTGITNNITKRLDTHKKGKGSKYVRSNLPFVLVYLETIINRSEASKKEYKIKRMTKQQKEELINSSKNERSKYETISN